MMTHVASWAFCDDHGDVFLYSDTYDHPPSDDEVMRDGYGWYRDEVANEEHEEFDHEAYEEWRNDLFQLGVVLVVAKLDGDGNLVKEWIDLNEEHTRVFDQILVDESSGENQKVTLKIAEDGITISAEGYGCAADEDGPPVFVELFEGKLWVKVWADIGLEDASHSISLDGAKESLRKGKSDA